MREPPIAALEEPRVHDFLCAARVAHLATADAAAAPHAVPLCYWFDGAHFYFVIDEKPKRRGPGGAIKRMRNIAANPSVAIIVDHYEEDWSQLAFVMIRGRAAIVADGEEYMLALRNLRDKYIQYRAMTLAPERNPIVRIDPERVNLWGARFAPAGGAS
ncbi:MAG TPA: TIGR03668 family PPOX class F420-dependent oxidoreductase [Candidatus Binataceae bacterium]|nr:TIGR03668 family PPOX class F420-dependent oxidoreductase [Candidatus Binataceae bacterium]